MPLTRILVADDEESMRWVLSKALKRKGFSVDLAIDGRQALSMIQDGSYDLAILDIKMPGINGLDLLDKIRELKKDLLVVIMTAEASMKNAVEAMKRGAYDYITKPFDLDVIDAIIEKVGRPICWASRTISLPSQIDGICGPTEKIKWIWPPSSACTAVTALRTEINSASSPSRL